MVGKLQQDNAALQSEKAELEGKLKAADEELKKAKGQADRLRKDSKALQVAQKERRNWKASLHRPRHA